MTKKEKTEISEALARLQESNDECLRLVGELRKALVSEGKIPSPPPPLEVGDESEDAARLAAASITKTMTIYNISDEEITQNLLCLSELPISVNDFKAILWSLFDNKMYIGMDSDPKGTPDFKRLDEENRKRFVGQIALLRDKYIPLNELRAGGSKSQAIKDWWNETFSERANDTEYPATVSDEESNETAADDGSDEDALKNWIS